jgi:hypothetical protein
MRRLFLYGLIVSIAVFAVGCADKQSPSPEKLFELRAKCDQLVREKFDLMEQNSKFIYSAVGKSVTSNLQKGGDCHGYLERYINGGSNLIVIDGVSGEELVTIAIAGDFVSAMVRDDRGNWLTVDKQTAEKRISEFMN